MNRTSDEVNGERQDWRRVSAAGLFGGYRIFGLLA